MVNAHTKIGIIYFSSFVVKFDKWKTKKLQLKL